MRLFIVISVLSLIWTPLVWCASIPWTKDRLALSQATNDEPYLRSAAREAIRRHSDNPKRCSQYQISKLLWDDTRAIFQRQTGREAPSCPFICSRCHTVFDDYIQSILHEC